MTLPLPRASLLCSCRVSDATSEHAGRTRECTFPLRTGFDPDSADPSGNCLLHWLAGGVELPESCVTLDGNPTAIRWCVCLVV